MPSLREAKEFFLGYKLYVIEGLRDLLGKTGYCREFLEAGDNSCFLIFTLLILSMGNIERTMTKVHLRLKSRCFLSRSIKNIIYNVSSFN